MRQGKFFSKKALHYLSCLFLIGCVLLGSGCTDPEQKITNESEAPDQKVTNESEAPEALAANESGAEVSAEPGALVKTGARVKVDYTGKLEDGTVFDTSIKETAIEAGIFSVERIYEPLSFTVGAGQMIKGFDEGVIGMKVGEEKTLRIPPEKAYGEFQEELVQAYPLSQLGLDPLPVAGQKLMSIYGPVTVVAVNETHATLDFNPELAGKTLVFEVKLVSLYSN